MYQFPKYKDMILPASLIEHIGGYSTLSRIANHIYDEMKAVRFFYNKIILYNDKEGFIDLLKEILNNILRDNIDWCNN